MRQKLTVFVLVCFVFSFKAQQPKLSRPEKWWSFTHPWAAIKVKTIAKKCKVVYQQNLPVFKPDTFLSGGRPDAFRHAFYMAAFAQKIRPRALIKLGKAHEKGNYRQYLNSRMEDLFLPDSASGLMDLFNNAVGLELGRHHRQVSLEQLASLCINAINEGKMKIIKRNKIGERVSCNNQVPDPFYFAGKWNIPFCLVPSNEAYID